MDISFDPAKDARNVACRGLSFARAADFDWAGADIIEDARFAIAVSGLSASAKPM